MKTYIKILLFIGAVAVLFCFAMGIALSAAVGEIEGLRLSITELQREVENRQELIGHCGESKELSDMGESDKAMLEVIKTISEIESANITIDTPEAHFHIEWQR